MPKVRTTSQQAAAGLLAIDQPELARQFTLWRRIIGKTQEECAVLLGVSKAQIQGIERGAKALGTKTSEALLGYSRDLDAVPVQEQIAALDRRIRALEKKLHGVLDVKPN